jgi:hypothetical protein
VNTLLQEVAASAGRHSLAIMPNLVVRVWLPDRPGALGLVASRIGAIGGDIVGVDVLERSETVAVDEFSVVLRRDDVAALLVREIEEVDGASVEECREVDTFPDPATDALESVEVLGAATDVKDLARLLVNRVCVEFAADWAAVVKDGQFLASLGDGTPDASVLEALAAGTAASPAVAAGDAGPDDLAVAPVTAHDAVLLAGRDGRPFRRRERVQLLALARIAARLVPQGR